MDDRSRNRLVGAWLGVLVAALGAIVLAGWYLRAPVLVQLHPSWVPMQYNTALVFVALGLALIALAAGRRWFASVLGAVPLLIGGVTLTTWVFDLHPGIDELLFRHYITIFTPAPGRMSPNTAFCFVLAGTALVLTTLPQQAVAAVVSRVLGFFVCACGLAAALWTIVHASESPAQSVRFTYMAVHTGIGLVLAGAALGVLTAGERAVLPDVERIWEWPVGAGLAIAVVSLVLWQAFTVAEDRRIRTGTQEAQEQMVAALEADSHTWQEAMGRTARRTAREATTLPDAIWAAAAQEYFRGNSWLREIVWFNVDGSVRQRIVRDPEEYLPDPVTEIAPLVNEEFRRALATRAVQLYRSHGHGHPPLEHLGYILAPFEYDDTAGVLAFTARLDALFEQAIGETARGYSAEISDAGHPVFTRFRQEPASGRDFGSEKQEVGVYWRRWVLEVRPGPEILARSPTLLPKLTLLFGLALSLLMAAALRYAGVARQRTAGIVSARALLEREVEERRRAEVYARTSEERARLALAEMQQIVNQSQDLICIFDAAGNFRLVSASAKQILGYGPAEMVGRPYLDFLHDEDRDRTAVETAALQAGKVTRDFENRFRHRDGKTVHLSWSAAWLADARTCYAIARDVTRRNRQDALREGQRAVLQLVATGSPLRRVLNEICEYIERIDPEAFCSIVLLDPEGDRIKTAAAPRLPPEFVAAMEGVPIGPAVGSCGTAMWRREPVIAGDIESDPLWQNYLGLSRPHGLRACWSMPIMGSDSRVLGSFAIYHFRPRRPEAQDIEMIESAAGLASVAIERDQVQSRLVESREQLEFARRLAQLGYWEIYLDTGRTVLSADMLEMLGLSPAADHDFDYLVEFIMEADRASLLAARKAAIRYDVPIDLECRLLLPGGSVRHLQVRGRAVRRHDGWVLKLVGTVQDITARKEVELENARLYVELEQRVQSRTRELELSNRELEAFSYSVSHDLRAPLRAIAGFSALLQDQHAASIDAQGRHYLDRVIAGTVRMSALIDDLLELGRVNRVEIVRQPLDLSALATAVSSRFHERWPERVVDVEIQPDLVVWGDLRLMEVAFENLLDNAWKFTAERSSARIRVGREVQEGHDVFFVADNGVGFDPQYAANLFGVFQRLHAASAFPGTGVGLATVQRILQRHGGRIWAHAGIDEGATFYFTVSEKP